MAIVKKVEDPKLRNAYNIALKKFGANSPQALAAREKLNANRQSLGLNINVNRPGTNNAGGTGSGTITNQTGVTQTGYADLTGASNAFLAELSNIGKGATEARDTTYSYLTRNLERDKARDMETSKQELAQRGIPIDPTQESLWNKTIGGIDQQYKDLDTEASQKALIAGNQFYNDSVNRATQLGGVAAGFIDTLTQSYIQKYGIDKDTATKMAQIEVQKIAASKVGSGGGGGSGDDGGDIFLT